MSDDNLPALDANGNPLVRIENGAVFTDSRDVAFVFEKRHKDVLEAIANLIKADPSLAQRYFRPGVYTLESTGKQQHRLFTMERDGFSLLAMGFTGAKAVKWKVAYIDAFNMMEAKLKEAPVARSQYDWMRAVVDDMEAHNQRLFAVENAVKALGAHEDQMSIKAYAAVNGIKLKDGQSTELGRIAKSLSRQLKKPTGTQPDATYGKVNTYHRDILEQVFKQVP